MSLPKTIKTERLYHGRIIDLIIEEVENTTGDTRKREIVRHPGGSVVVPLCNGGDVILVRQYRYPHNKFILELPAGKLEPGEDPLFAAQRELQEETGYTADKYEKTYDDIHNSWILRRSASYISCYRIEKIRARAKS